MLKVTTSAIWSVVAANVPCIFGRATFTIITVIVYSIVVKVSEIRIAALCAKVVETVAAGAVMLLSVIWLDCSFGGKSPELKLYTSEPKQKAAAMGVSK